MSRSSRPAHTENLLTSLVFVVPLLVFYEIAVLNSRTINGADLVTDTLLRTVGRSGFIWIQLGVLAAVIGLALILRTKQRFNWKRIFPIILESALYASTMGVLISMVMVDVLGIDPRLAVDPLKGASVFERLVMAVGAGVHEELMFRLGMMGGILLLCDRALRLRRWLSVLIALLVSSIAFALAHHIGPLGEPLRLGVFVYRAIAGVLFGLLYRYRGLAIAVYTHTLYDIYVMIIL
ncbi:MAG: CPBP family intramembrane metalloprotease [Deltaproteobacteria bacterium]|nr:CPBP family intramembrane metalloprotease [Deltaproteobacteria bacterium]